MPPRVAPRPVARHLPSRSAARSTPRPGLNAVLLAIGLLASPALTPVAAAREADPSRSREERIRELERKVEVLIEEIEKLKTEQVVPEEPPLESEYGLGPAASKVYRKDRGISLGGYGEANYRAFVDDSAGESNRTDLERLVLYTGYKFSDHIVFNSEIEFEHASTDNNGSVSVEFATLDFLWREEANLRAGLVLVPMGFLNEIHEPPFFHGVSRPVVDRRIIPTTWRENGLGIFGSALDKRLTYRAYAINGFDATGFEPDGLRGGRQKGSEALAEHVAGVARVDWSPTDSLLIGGSVYYGNSGQNQNVSGNNQTVPVPDTPTAVFEAHAQYRSRGLQLRAVYAEARLQDTGALTNALRATGKFRATDVVAKRMIGAYGEVAYDVLPLLFPETGMSLEPFYRYEFIDTQKEVASGFSRDRRLELQGHTVGFSFKPHPSVVIKADYRNFAAKRGSAPDEVEIGLGFVF